MHLNLLKSDKVWVKNSFQNMHSLRCRRYRHVRRKLHPLRVLGLLLSLAAISAFSCFFSAFTWTTNYNTELFSSPIIPQSIPVQHRTLLGTEEEREGNISKDLPVAMKRKAEDNRSEAVSQGEYPEDLFSLEERKRGAVILHMIGMVYMFIALAIVCDEFFVPSLTVIIEKFAISDDVAGATFMAAGGSAPELFTSIIGVFISHSNVGIGTIVGSAVFNILFVIGMCALFSKEILNLTWWPLFRDVSFYIIDLIMLIIFFLDNVINWYESTLLLMSYTAYVIFMKYNERVEGFIKSKINRNKVVEVSSAESQAKAKPRLQRGGSSASLHNSLMRNSIFQLMIHTLDPLAEEFADSELGTYGKLKYYDSMTEAGKFREKASILHKMAKNKCQVDDSERPNGIANHGDKVELPNSANVEVEVTPPKDSRQIQNGNVPHDIEADGQGGEASDGDDEDQPLSLAWPDTNRKRLTYLVILPIVFPLWLTVPDVRKPTSKRFFPLTFLGSICWIACFSYLMVWWAHQVGETIGITEEIMGLTILAAGTSIPDLITSVIVARKGLGDMAVSSSVGSNIFDITVGLPLPWLLYSIINVFAPVHVSSNGLFCAIVLLFLMLLFVIMSIALCKWRMSKSLGFTMFLLYFVFLVVSVLLEDKILVCPVSI
ncbi:sodium/potassium/calcium exchanger 2-like isoform X2 [Erpetoichthys calabaricus]|uniref:sodium/potassium/calcium exchanger 2-like isoform X2 n=1 Tax=Erpetoichthys calabaricus TaxID=27687 RepID=UPI002233E760|nr:sodium/potassium/calcium exchanger 2-like isoform X2 [Erpetoichthys calabaricus]